jgi:hypothetical protein
MSELSGAGSEHLVGAEVAIILQANGAEDPIICAFRRFLL